LDRGRTYRTDGDTRASVENEPILLVVGRYEVIFLFIRIGSF
jgi:hypothetical protein